MNQLQITMQQASSLDTEKRMLALEHLKSLEIQPNYHISLLDISINNTLPIKTRSLAIICLKNGICKYWRPSGKNTISTIEKQQLRQSLLMNLNLDSKTVIRF